MRSSASHTILALIFVFASFAHAGAYVGTVVRDPGGEPIAGAYVGMCIYVDGGHLWIIAITDADGRFELQQEDTDRAITIVAAADGYALGQAVAVPGRDVTIALPDDPATLTGTVVGEGRPIAGAEVSVRNFRVNGRRYDNFSGVYAWEHAPRATTDAEGRFELQGLPPDSGVLLRVGAPGWAEWRSASTADLLPIAERAAIRMWPEAVIEGRALVDGEPAAGVEVRAEPTHHGPQSGSATTDAEGRYRIGDLGSGSWYLAAPATEEAYSPRRVLVNVAPGETAVADVELRDLSDAPLVTGTVTFGDTGEPAVGAVIGGGHMDAPEPHRHWEATADEQGRYELRLPEGQVAIAYMGNVDGYSPEGAQPGHRFVTLGAEGRQLDFILDPTPQEDAPNNQVPCLVTGPDGKSVAGALVFDPREPYYGPPARRPMVADEHGQLTITPPHEGEREYLVTDPAGTLCRMIGVSALQLRLEVRLQRAAWAEARIVDIEGRPVAGVACTVQVGGPDRKEYPFPGEDDLPCTGVSDEQGLVRLGPLPPGYPVVFAPGAGPMLVEDPWEPLGEVTPEPGEVIELPPLVLDPAGRTLTGRLVDADGGPVIGAMVLSSHGINRVALTTSDEDGRFQLEGLWMRGEVPVTAFTEGGSLAACAKVNPGNWPRPARGHPAGDAPEEFALVLRPLASAEGTVRDRDGEPVSGAEVVLHSWALARSAVVPPALIRHAVVPTDTEGHWMIEGLVPGAEYRVAPRDPVTGDQPLGIRFIAGEAAGEIELTLGDR